MFSIDRVFRNETLDATHLAEFHQVEGVVAERNLSLAHVIGLFTEFFRKIGMFFSDLRLLLIECHLIFYNPFVVQNLHLTTHSLLSPSVNMLLKRKKCC